MSAVNVTCDLEIVVCVLIGFVLGDTHAGGTSPVHRLLFGLFRALWLSLSCLRKVFIQCGLDKSRGLLNSPPIVCS